MFLWYVRLYALRWLCSIIDHMLRKLFSKLLWEFDFFFFFSFSFSKRGTWIFQTQCAYLLKGIFWSIRQLYKEMEWIRWIDVTKHIIGQGIPQHCDVYCISFNKIDNGFDLINPTLNDFNQLRKSMLLSHLPI